MSEKHPECPLYNPLNCKEYYNPKLCAFVKKDKICLKKKRKTKKQNKNRSFRFITQNGYATEGKTKIFVQALSMHDPMYLEAWPDQPPPFSWPFPIFLQSAYQIQSLQK